MSAPDHTILEFRPPAIPDAVPIDDLAFAAWLDELAGDVAVDNCESCQRNVPAVFIQFRDGVGFDVCTDCASDATMRGGVPLVRGTR